MGHECLFRNFHCYYLLHDEKIKRDFQKWLTVGFGCRPLNFFEGLLY